MTETVIDKDKEVKEEKSAINMTADELRLVQTQKEEDVKSEETEEAKAEREAKEKKESEKKEEVTISKEEYDKLQKRLKDKDTFIDILKKEKKQEVGRLKKQLEEKKETLENAIGGMEMAKAIKDVNKTEDDLQNAEFEANMAGIKENVLSKYEDFEDKIPEISKLLEKDGFNKKDIAEFETSPYINDPLVLSNLYERAVISLALQGKETELEKLKTDNETLKNKSKEFIDNIEKGSSRQTMTAGSGGTGQSEKTSGKKSVVNMSREELREAEKGG